jgi:hypothetical protein
MRVHIYALAHQWISIFDTSDHSRGDEFSWLISLPAKNNGARRVVKQIFDTAEVCSIDEVTNILRGNSTRRIELIVSTNIGELNWACDMYKGL